MFDGIFNKTKAVFENIISILLTIWSNQVKMTDHRIAFKSLNMHLQSLEVEKHVQIASYCCLTIIIRS